MSAKSIDWKPIAAHFGKTGRNDVIIYAYELKRSFGSAARLLSEAGRSISNGTVRNVLHEIGHEIYLRTNTRQIKPKQKQYRDKLESRRSHKKKSNGGQTCTWPGCHKSTGDNHFFCSTHFVVAGKISGIEDMGMPMSHGMHGARL